MTEKVAMARRPGRRRRKLLEACRAAARTMHAFDMAAMAEASGSVISAVLFGAMAGAGVLPFPRQAFEAAIRRGGVGIKASLGAFTAGFEAVTNAAEAPKPVPGHCRRRRSTDRTRTCVRRGRRRTADPGRAVARGRDISAAARAHRPCRHRANRRLPGSRLCRLYLDRLAAVATADRDGRLIAETARQLALCMSYEDTIRVAELKIRAIRFARVREEVKANDEQILEIAEFMHPRIAGDRRHAAGAARAVDAAHDLDPAPDRRHDDARAAP